MAAAEYRFAVNVRGEQSKAARVMEKLQALVRQLQDSEGLDISLASPDTEEELQEDLAMFTGVTAEQMKHEKLFAEESWLQLLNAKLMEEREAAKGKIET